jgi:type IV pilus assembly protein PilC
MPIHRSLSASLRATSNGAFIAATPIVTDAVKSGETLGDALALTQLFPEEFLHMVHVGESAGTVPETLHRLSPQFEDQARRSLSVLTSALAWGIWMLVAGFIIFIIFRVFSWYTGMLNDALKGIG